MAGTKDTKHSSSGLDFQLHPVCREIFHDLDPDRMNKSVHSAFLCRSQLVLLNVSDHHTRAKANLQDANQPPPRVLGCLLGQQAGRVVDVSNSFEFVYENTASGLVIDEGLLTKKTEQCKLETVWLTCFTG